MLYKGQIISEGGNPVPGATVAFQTPQGSVITALHTNAAGAWQIDTEFDGGLLQSGNEVQFSAPGYYAYTITTDTLSQNFTVTLVKKPNTVLPWMIAAVMGAVVFLGLGKKKAGGVGKIGPQEVQTILTIVGGLIGVSVIYKILKLLHLADDPNDKGLNDESANPLSVWNPNYWQTYYPGQTETDSLSAEYAASLADKIRSDLGVFYDDEDGVTAAIHALRTRSDVSFLAETFAARWGSDLLTYLRNGRGSLPENGLSPAEVANLNSYVYSLPVK